MSSWNSLSFEIQLLIVRLIPQDTFVSISGIENYFKYLNYSFLIDEDFLKKEITIEDVNLSYSPIKNVSLLDQYKIHSLDLTRTYVTDVSCLGNVHTLKLHGCCINNESLKMLKHVHTLDLSYCKGIYDVSMLGNVHTLDLSYCKGIYDVSMLGGVHALNLSKTSPSGVAFLGNVHTLNLSNCSYLGNLSVLRNVHTLSLSKSDIGDLDIMELRNVHALDLSYTFISDDGIQNLGGVHTLNLRGCKHILNVSALKHVHTLDLRETNITDFSELQNVNLFTDNNRWKPIKFSLLSWRV
jgi:hypothetical protein